MTSPSVSSGDAASWSDPAPARLTVGIVSAGRVGSALGAALERAGHVVFGVAAISDASVRRARTRLPESRILPVEEVAASSELLILAVPDTELAGLVGGLASAEVVRPGTIVAHTSGVNGIGVLAPLTELGALPLAIHPAMTFTGHDEDLSRLANACFGITAADEIGYAIAQSLVIEMGGEPVRVAEQNRTLYHAALAHGSNHLVTMIVDAVAALRVALAGPGLLGQQIVDDQPNGLAERLLAPLASAALDNALRRGQSALTGPVARGDSAAVAAHLDALEAVDPRLSAGYRALALRTAERANPDPALIELLEERR
ncbi:oxidoreductase [Nocardia donostiensis]|uniref:Oxidoreductase n=1 Tax=Nocardia donostiensis TaxID=1538463 RepID=A0A1V2TDF9_9NOCA|nr:oxidoreductase [Nocardia donostiensis]OQS14393.1 oxidoreductase [Nocardia donostiensis]OQS24152.1 oxidoreductase [Nocardia donostiensis]